jgi:hypothetical protein
MSKPWLELVKRYAIFRSLLVEHITPNPLANLPIEQGDRGIDGPSRSCPRLLDEGPDVFEQIARLRGGRKSPGFWHQNMS